MFTWTPVKPTAWTKTGWFGARASSSAFVNIPGTSSWATFQDPLVVQTHLPGGVCAATRVYAASASARLKVVSCRTVRVKQW